MCLALLHPTIHGLKASGTAQKVQPAFPGSEVGDVGHSQHVACRRSELALHEIVGDSDARHADRSDRGAAESAQRSDVCESAAPPAWRATPTRRLSGGSSLMMTAYPKA
jgi:hypothetical protein